MSLNIETIKIKKVSPASDPLSKMVGRGVFNADSIKDFLAQSFRDSFPELVIDLSLVGWVSLFDWSCLLALLHGRLEKAPNLKISLDFLGSSSGGLIEYRKCANYIAGKLEYLEYSQKEYVHSYIVHRLLNFVRALEGPDGFLNVADGRLTLRWLSEENARRPAWYRQNEEVGEVVILPRTSISEEQACIQFASRSQIETWRTGMRDKRLPDASVFASDEFWRILCHELAKNVFEHADGPGFISARVVLPVKKDLPHWCAAVYNRELLECLSVTKDSGFLELCVCDAGLSIPKTIELSFRNRYKERHYDNEPPEPISHADLLKFAFDELGTCKDSEESWLTDRHALGQILYVVSRYNGAIIIRSGCAELCYIPHYGALQRSTTQMGFEPDHAPSDFKPAIPGTHIQILIPLSIRHNNASPVCSAYDRHLPSTFYVDPKYPFGPLMPIRDKFEVFSSCIQQSDEVVKFREICSSFADSLLNSKHPREEIMVFDFAEVDWTPAQFETFLYLLQNVLLRRPVIFTNLNQEFAALVCAQEESAKAPTYLTQRMISDIHNQKHEREFTDGRFLETYSGIGALVLGLGSETGEFLFGLRDKRLRKALLAIINGAPASVKQLAAYHGVDVSSLLAVLKAAPALFRCLPDNTWDLAWPRHVSIAQGEPVDTLAVQRLRSIVGHFDRVAETCKAWRGTNVKVQKTRVKNERFYLPTEDAVYSPFFETSRILARERYVDEVAERMIHRICFGLANYCTPILGFHQVDVLACSTTPSVMLAQAIRRAWPKLPDNKRPVVIDYGPTLFSGADPAQILVQDDKKLSVIVVHDVFDEGHLSRKLIDVIQSQRMEVLFEISFIRFVSGAGGLSRTSCAFSPKAEWEINAVTNKRIHAMIGLERPRKEKRQSVIDWGCADLSKDYVVDPRSLRPVALPTLRLESDYSAERSLTTRDHYLKELDKADNKCRLAAGHFVYGQRHFSVVADIRAILTSSIGHKIVDWLADVCCDKKPRNVSWEDHDKGRPLPEGPVSAILMPLHSQIHYLLPELERELAQRGKRVPCFFLDVTSFGGGMEIYDIPYQFRDQIRHSATEIKRLKSSSVMADDATVSEKQLRILIIDDAMFSGRTLQTVLDSLAKHCLDPNYGVQGVGVPQPIAWIRAFGVLNQLPSAKSALWFQLNSCRACNQFRFDAYASFIGVETFFADDCPVCKELAHLIHLEHRADAVDASEAIRWIKKRKERLSPFSTEAPTFLARKVPALPEPIDVLALPGGGAPDRYKPIHVDSAIWRFYELMYLSYPLRDVLGCLSATRKSGQQYPESRAEYARFRLAIYDWITQHWHHARLYHIDEKVLRELQAEVMEGESLFSEVCYKLHVALPDDSVTEFLKWVIQFLANSEKNESTTSSETRLDLEIGLRLLFFSLSQHSKEYRELCKLLEDNMAQKSKEVRHIDVLYQCVTRPLRVADPKWALNTIAETCFRGYIRKTSGWCCSEHLLLGQLVEQTGRIPNDDELRRKLEGSISCFLAAVEALIPYFHVDLIPEITKSARQVEKWLLLPAYERENKVDVIDELRRNLCNEECWEKFAVNCNQSVQAFCKDLYKIADRLKESLPTGAFDFTFNVELSSDVKRRSLLTHIPRLLECISNLAIKPAKDICGERACKSDVIVSVHPEFQHQVQIVVQSDFRPPDESFIRVSGSDKIAVEFECLNRFGVVVDLPKSPTTAENVFFRLVFSIPVGFCNKEV